MFFGDFIDNFYSNYQFSWLGWKKEVKNFITSGFLSENLKQEKNLRLWLNLIYDIHFSLRETNRYYLNKDTRKNAPEVSGNCFCFND